MPRKIAFWRTVVDSFEFVFGNFDRFIRLAGPWVAIAAILFATLIAIFGIQALESARFGQAHAAPLTVSRSVSTIVLGIYMLAAYVAFSVAWHRAVLLGEAGSTFGALRFRRREWRFLGYWVVVGLLALAIGLGMVIVLVLVGVVIFLIATGGAFSTPHDGTKSLLLIPFAITMVGFIVILPFLARFSLGLPAIAVEEPDGVLRRSWHRGWRNGWRLIWGPLLCAIPLSIAVEMFQGAQLATAFFLGSSAGLLYALGFILSILFYAFATAAHFVALAGAITFLSLSYRQLTQPS